MIPRSSIRSFCVALSALLPGWPTLLVASGQTEPSPATQPAAAPDWLTSSVSAEVADALDRVNRGFSEAWMRGDVAAILDAYSTSATVQPPPGGILKSRSALLAVWEPIRKWDRVAHRIEPTLRQTLGPGLVLEMGRWHSSRKSGDRLSAATGCYTVIWERAAGDRWKMLYDAWGAPNDASWACRPRI